MINLPFIFLPYFYSSFAPRKAENHDRKSVDQDRAEVISYSVSQTGEIAGTKFSQVGMTTMEIVQVIPVNSMVDEDLRIDNFDALLFWTENWSRWK